MYRRLESADAVLVLPVWALYVDLSRIPTGEASMPERSVGTSGLLGLAELQSGRQGDVGGWADRTGRGNVVW